jgi:DNA repair protein RadA/Sms
VRRCIGVDSKRVDMILAILNKYLKMNTDFVDIFINIPGETVYSDSGLDLAIAAAIMSQYKNLAVSKSLIFVGEIALS